MSELSKRIRQNIESCREKIELAAKKSGRPGNLVSLVVVTKSQPIAVVEAAIEAGAVILGENYPEETLPKIEAVGERSGIEWHMIGHLQSRKARLVVDNFDLLHSLDSVSLAQKLNRLLVESHKTLPVLLEVNVGGEASKYGWQGQNLQEWELLLPDVAQVLACSNLQVKGLMTMPPLFDEAELVRPYFQRLRKLNEMLKAAFPAVVWKELSMGTSADYEIAVEEGATMVRVGTAIVGARLQKE